MQSKTLGRLFLNRVKESADRPAIGWMEGESVNRYTFAEYGKIVENLAKGLDELGLKRGMKLSILGFTSKEWHLVDMATMCSGATTIPIYPTYTAEEVHFQIEHSESEFIAVENNDQYKKFLKIQDQLPNIKVLIYFQDPKDDVKGETRKDIKVVSYSDLYQKGKVSEIEISLEDYVSRVEEKDPATIIYTSGTTGEPKGALVTNEGLAQMIINLTELKATLTDKDRTLSWLPLSHVFGRVDSLFPTAFGLENVYGRSIDKILDDIVIVKPTLMCAVPRIFEKIYAKINKQIEGGSFIKRHLFAWAQEVSNKYFDKIEKDLSPTPTEILQRKIAYNLVLSKVYEKFGGRMRFFVSGGAPLSQEIFKFLRNCNLVILEGYGLTETIGPCCVNPPSKQLAGCVGKPLGDTEFKIAEDGELLIKTVGMLKEYYKKPDATAEAIKDGWFYSGDIAEFNEQGYLKITDRKKEILITSGGKNVAPQKIENLMKTQKYISQFVVAGEKQKYLTAIVGLEKETFFGEFSNFDLEEDCTLEEISKNEKVYAAIKAEVEQVNQGLAQYETIKKFYISPKPFDIDSGFITPSLKVKRKIVYKAFEGEINAMY